MFQFFGAGNKGNEGGAGAEGARPGLVDRIRNMRAANTTRFNAAQHDGTYPRAEALTAQRNDTILRAPCDNASVFQALGAAGCNILPCILRACDVAPFSAQAVQANEVRVMRLRVASIISALRVRGQDLRVQQVIAECLAPGWPEDRVLAAADSRAELDRLLANVGKLRELGWFADRVQEMARAHPAGQDGVHVLARAWDCTTRTWVAGVTLDLQMNFLLQLVNLTDERQASRSLYPVLLIILAFATRGKMTAQRLQRFIDDLRGPLGAVIEMLRIEDVTLTWANFGHLVNDGNIEEILQMWYDVLPVSAIRLRVSLDQAAGAGLTSLDTITRAITSHPHFPWHIVRRMFPSEWAAALKAIGVVGGNRYYGYRADLTAVRSTQYKYLSWVCGRVLIMVDGDKALSRYKGFVPHKPSEKQVKELITAYIESLEQHDLMAEQTMEDKAAIEEMLIAAKGYPADNRGGGIYEGQRGQAEEDV